MYEGDSTQLYYVRNWWYDPAVGRFVDEDPSGIAGSPNLYAFAGNDPIDGTDPLGLDGGGAIEVAHGCGFWGDVKRTLLHAIFGGGGDINCHHHAPLQQPTNAAMGIGERNLMAAQRIGQLLTPFENAMTTGASGAVVTGLISPVGEDVEAVEEGVTLFRAVQDNELADIIRTGTYRMPEGMGEVKGFFSTPEEAARFARRYFTSRP